MTNDDSENKRKVVLSRLDAVERGDTIEKALKSHGNHNKDARKKKIEYGLEGLTDTSLYDGNARYASKEDFEARVAEEEREAKLEEGAQFRLVRSEAMATRGLIQNIDNILKTEGKYDSKLVDIANSKDIMESASAGDDELLNAYANYKKYDNIVKKLKDKKKVRLEDKEELRKFASVGMGRKKYKEFRGKGYTEVEAQAVAKVSELAPTEEVDNETLLIGAEEIRRKVESRVKEIAGKDVNYKERIAEIVGKSLTEMAKSGDAQKEITAAHLYYRSQKGYGLGERKYNDVFPKEVDAVRLAA